ncbi:MAG: tripartite tricarboxylate transporter substrate binding protein [Burkholderiales bacterium]
MKNPIARRFVLATCLAAAATFAAHAQEAPYPAKPVTFVVPFSAGSTTDGLARVIAQEISRETGQSVVVDNKVGAGGSIAAQAAARAAPDGYTVFVTTNTTQSANPHLYKKLSYDPVKDFEPVAALVKGYQMMVVRPTLEVNSVADVIALAKKEPGKLTFGAGSSSARVAVELLQQMTGIKLLHVPYKANPLAITDLVGGTIDLMIVDLTTSLPQVKAGKLKGLAVTSPERLSLVSDLPTMSEAGVKGYEMSYWGAAYAPAKTPAPIVARINELMVKAVATPSVRKFIDSNGMVPYTTSPEELGHFQDGEIERWGKIIKAAGIQPE